MTRRTFFGWLSSLLAMLAGAARGRPAAAQSTYPPPMTPEMRAEWDRLRSKALEAVPYERVEVSGESALAEWKTLRAAGRGWPVIVGDDEQLDAIAEQFSLDEPSVFGQAGSAAPTPAAILDEASKLDFPQSLSLWPGTDPDLPDPPLGEWPTPGTVRGSGLTVASDILSGKPFPKVHILLIPTTKGWEVPAYLRWGNWNACPPPAQHVAALRTWHDRFGVELVGINRDTMNLIATRPPVDRAKALALADEHYRYCPDVIDQGVGNLSALASLLMTEKWWFFWWD